MKRHFFPRLTAAALSLSLLMIPAAQALTLEQAGELIQLVYVDEVPQSVLEQPTISDMIEALGDPYTEYFTSQEYAEFTASMKDGENDLDRGDFLFRMLVDRDAAAVVDNRDGIVFVNRDIDFGAIAGKGLVDGVVHNLIHKVVQTTRTRRTDIHAGAHTHGFKALEDLNV